MDLPGMRDEMRRPHDAAGIGGKAGRHSINTPPSPDAALDCMCSPGSSPQAGGILFLVCARHMSPAAVGKRDTAAYLLLARRSSS